MDGREVLAIIKEDAMLKSIPTVVLTTSAAETDIAQSYRLHANSYFTKPSGFEEIDGLVRCLNKFWLEKAKLP